MTIAIGMRMRDGIVLAADRLLSTEQHQFEDRKVDVIDLNFGKVFTVYADAPATAKEVVEKLETRLHRKDDAINGISVNAIRVEVETVLNEVYNNRMGNMPLQMLFVAEHVYERMQLWHYEGSQGFHSVDEFAVIGIGESSLIRYLQTAYLPSDNVETGANLAIYLLAKAEQFIPFCRGADVLMLPSEGSWTWLDDEQVAARLGEMQSREREQLRKIITG